MGNAKQQWSLGAENRRMEGAESGETVRNQYTEGLSAKKTGLNCIPRQWGAIDGY